MADILEKILATKRAEVASAKALVSGEAMKVRALASPAARDFLGAMRAKIAAGKPAVIAEIKRASPSKGVLRENFDPAAIARSYQAGGAACLSVLTDREYFQGAPEHLGEARAACTLPVLRKDFMLDPYQVYEARAWGADCILLIAAALDDEGMSEMEAIARQLGMSVLVEVHDQAELGRALRLRTPLMGINNRDLRSFVTRLEVTLGLKERVPPGRILVTESGIRSDRDIKLMTDAGIHAFLVGEAFMSAPDPGKALAVMIGS